MAQWARGTGVAEAITDSGDASWTLEAKQQDRPQRHGAQEEWRCVLATGVIWRLEIGAVDTPHSGVFGKEAAND